MVVPFDSNNNLHPKIMEKKAYKNIKDVMKKYYTYSRVEARTGAGRNKGIKLTKNINSASLEMRDKQGNYTTIREIVLNKEKEGKKMFKAIAVTPTKGDKGSVLTIIVTRRSGDIQRNKDVL